MFKKLKNEKKIKIIFYLKLYIIKARQSKTKSLPEPTSNLFWVFKNFANLSQTYLFLSQTLLRVDTWFVIILISKPILQNINVQVLQAKECSLCN